MGVGAQGPDPVGEPHRLHRPEPRGIADARAVEVRVVGREPEVAPLVEEARRLVQHQEEAALHLHVGVVGEVMRVGIGHEGGAGGEEGDRRSGLPERRIHEEGDPLGDLAGREPRRIEPARQVGRQNQLEIRRPAAIGEIILVEMHRGIMRRPLRPAHHAAVPMGARHAARRQIDQLSVQPVPALVLGALGPDAGAEIPGRDEPVHDGGRHGSGIEPRELGSPRQAWRKSAAPRACR